MASVMTNNEKATAYKLLYSMVPAGVSPKLALTTNAVIVSMLRKGFSDSRGICPAAIVTAIVSPIAREIASRNDATIPDSSAGTTTFSDTSNFVEPSA